MVEVAVIAGNHKVISGNTSTFTEVNLLDVSLKDQGKETFSFPSNFNTGLLVVEGSAKVNDEIVNADHFLLFKNDGESFSIQSIGESKILILSGEPIQETIDAHGPFVMNTRQELIEAIDDFNSGKFGNLN